MLSIYDQASLITEQQLEDHILINTSLLHNYQMD